MHTQRHILEVLELSECFLSLTLWVPDPGASLVVVREDNPRLMGAGYSGRSQLYSNSISSFPCNFEQVHWPFWFCRCCLFERSKAVPKARLASYPCCRHRHLSGTYCPSNSLDGEDHLEAASDTAPHFCLPKHSVNIWSMKKSQTPLKEKIGKDRK